MINGKRVIAIIPARGGSKGIPDKNLYSIKGKSLVQVAIELARSNKKIEHVYVSTDSEKIYNIAKEFGAHTPKLRPAYLANDTSKTIDVIKDLVHEGLLKEEDILLLLQPTSPLRSSLQLQEILDLFKKNIDHTDAVVSICRIQDPHPLKTLKIENGCLQSFFDTNTSIPRQELRPAYRLNGAFYLIKLKSLLDEDSFLPQRTLPFEMDEKTSVNLDGPIDLLLLEAIVGKEND